MSVGSRGLTLVGPLDVADHVEPDHVHDAERGIFSLEEDHPESVDIFRDRDALIHDAQALALHRPPNSVNDESLALSPHDRRDEAKLLAEGPRALKYRLVRLAARHQLDHRPNPDRGEEVHVHHSLGPCDLANHVAGRDRGAVGGEDCGWVDRVHPAEKLRLDVDILAHGLDHEVHAGDRALEIRLEDQFARARAGSSVPMPARRNSGRI